MSQILSPAQQRAFDGLLSGYATGGVLVLKGGSGAGKTTVLQHLQAAIGGELLGMRQFMQSLEARQPAAIEEAFLDMIGQALFRSDIVIIDDLHMICNIVNRHVYQRTFLLDAALTAIFGEAAALQRKIVFALSGEAPWPLQRRAATWKIRQFKAADYEHICRPALGASAEGLDFARIHRFAPALSALQLCKA